jgi:hypothetical protein
MNHRHEILLDRRNSMELTIALLGLLATPSAVHAMSGESQAM